MICPECGSESKVKDSRDNRRSTYRRRECLKCGKRWSTFEVIHERGMDPYPMCKAEGCFKAKDESTRMDFCKVHYRAYRSRQVRSLAYKEKQRKREKLSRWKGARK